MEDSVRGQKLASVDGEGLSLEIRHLTSGFFHDERTRGHVPGGEVSLPETVKNSTPGIGQVQSRAAGAPNGSSDPLSRSKAPISR